MSKNSLANVKKDMGDSSTLPTVQVIKLGRRPKPEAEKASKPITLKFTQAEFDKISKKAGMINKATLLKKLLLDETDLLK
ncbi:MAG: hypothetical protein ACI88H_001980 [Cocleimonas sp.]|jgi:hypothetical protein